MVVVLMAPGFEESELVVPVDLLRRGGVEVKIAGVEALEVESSHGIHFTADMLLQDVALEQAEMVFVPGGLGGVNHILASELACGVLRKAKEQDKYLAAICAGPTVLSRLGLIDGVQAVCYPGMEDLLRPAVPQPGHPAVQDGKVLTAEAAGSAFDLGLLMLTVLKGKEAADKVRFDVHYHG
jgi:protein deglycase